MEDMELEILEVEATEPEEPKPLPRPNIDELEQDLNELKPVYTLRNDIIFKHRRITRMHTPEAGKDIWGDEVPDLVRLSIPNSVVMETARILGKADPMIEFVSESTDEKDERTAGDIEAFLHWAEGKFMDAYHRGGGQDSLAIARAKMLVQDGRLYSILTLRPEDPEFPFRLRIVDPTELYIRWGDDGIKRVFRATTMNAAQIRAEWGNEIMSDEVKDADLFNVISYWDRTWFAIWVDRGKEKNPITIKSPVRHGYPMLPVITTHVNGWIGTSVTTPGDDESTLEAYRGTGAFWPHENEYKKYLQVVDAQIHDTLLNAAPPIKQKLGPGNQAFEVEPEPDEVLTIPNGGDVEYLWKNGGLPHAKAASELISNIIQGGTLPVGQADFASGIDRMMATSRGQSFFIPYVEALKAHYRQLYRNVLLLFKEYGIPISITAVGPRGKTTKTEFSPFIIPNDPVVLVEFGDLTPVDVWQTVNAATGALAAGVLDEYTLWHDIIRHRQARAIVDRIRQARALAQQPVREQLVEVDTIDELYERADAYEAKGKTDLANIVRMKADMLKNQVMAQLEASSRPQPAAPAGDPIAEMLRGGAIPPELMQGMPPEMMQGMPPSQGMPPELMQGMPPSQGMPPPVPVPGLPGGNGTQGLPNAPQILGTPPQFMTPEMATGGMNQLDPQRLAAVAARPLMGA